VNDGAGANEADPGNDLCRNPGVIASVLACQLVGKQGEHGGPHADEQVGAQSSRSMFRLALQTNPSAEKRVTGFTSRFTNGPYGASFRRGHA